MSISFSFQVSSSYNYDYSIDLSRAQLLRLALLLSSKQGRVRADYETFHFDRNLTLPSSPDFSHSGISTIFSSTLTVTKFVSLLRGKHSGGKQHLMFIVIVSINSYFYVPFNFDCSCWCNWLPKSAAFLQFSAVLGKRSLWCLLEVAELQQSWASCDKKNKYKAASGICFWVRTRVE